MLEINGDKIELIPKPIIVSWLKQGLIDIRAAANSPLRTKSLPRNAESLKGAQ